MTDKSLVKIKQLYDNYKIAIWILPFMGFSVFDRLYNFWNVPSRLEADEVRFVEIRKKDSIMFHDYVNNANFVNEKFRFELKNLKDSLILTNKHKHK